MIEIMQPNDLEIPNLNDPFNHATRPGIYCAWARIVVPQLNLDTGKLILGKILPSMAGDDYNAFGILFKPEGSEQSKSFLYARMNWEINTPETPTDIKDQLREVLIKLDVLDWSKENDYHKAINVWTTNIRQFVSNQIRQNKSFQDAINYAKNAGAVLEPYWLNFLRKNEENIKLIGEEIP